MSTCHHPLFSTTTSTPATTLALALIRDQTIRHGVRRSLLQPLRILHLNLLAPSPRGLVPDLALVVAVAEAEGVVLDDGAGVDRRQRLPLARLGGAAGARGGGRVLWRDLGRGVVGVDVLDRVAERDVPAVWLGRLGRRGRLEEVGVAAAEGALGLDGGC